MRFNREMKSGLAGILLSAFSLTMGQATPEFFELPPIKYSEAASQDEMARWAAEIAAGEYVPTKGGSLVFLKTVLDRLNIPVESQVLVFSKTSLQTGIISQRNPRAIYFSNDAYVGWIPGGKIEVIVEDEKLGPVFYVLSAPFGDQVPQISRATDSCLQCHATSRTEGVPGLFIRSVIPDENGHALLRHGTTLVGPETPVRERWGGWYVTGESGGPHLGNRSTTDELGLEPEASDLKTLASLFDTEKYLAPTSDIVALMVLEHQCRVHNLMTKAKLSYRRTLWLQESLHKGGFQDDLQASPTSMVTKTVEQNARRIIEAMLFKNEAELEGDGIEGSAAFEKAFLSNGVKASNGKSLRQLKRYGRLFKYRCSYMIHSRAFRGLPKPVRERTLHLLSQAVSEEGVGEFAYLSDREKKVIRGILRDTIGLH